MKKLLYLFLAISIISCGGDDNEQLNLSIVGEWDLESVTGDSVDDCDLQTQAEFFDDLAGPLQEGWFYAAYEDSDGNCVVSNEDDSNSILLKYENIAEGNYDIYLKTIDEDFFWCEAVVNGNTMSFINFVASSTPIELIFSRL